MNYLILLALAISFSFGSLSAYCQSVGELRLSLREYRSSVEENKVMLDTLRNRLASYEVKREDAKNNIADTEADYFLAKENLDRAKAVSGYSQVDLDQLEQRHTIVEKGYLARKARLERVDRKLANIGEEIHQLETDTKRWEEMISEFEEAIQLKQKLAEQEMIDALKKVAEQQRVEREQNRVKEQALLAEMFEKKRLLALEAEVQVASREDQIEAGVEDGKVGAEDAELTALTEREVLSPHQRRARREMARLNRITQGSDKTERRHYLELILEIDSKQIEELEFLGNDQFYGEVSLQGGDHIFTINSFTFPVEVPVDESGDVFVVIYSSNGKQRGRLVYFNRNLLADGL